MGIIIMGCEGIEAIQWKKLVVDPNYKLAHNHVGFVIAKWLVECNKITPASHCDLYEVLCSLCKEVDERKQFYEAQYVKENERASPNFIYLTRE